MTKPTDVSVVLADFQFLTRKAIASLIEETSGFRLIAQIDSPDNLYQQINLLRPDLLVLDIFEKTPGYLEEIMAIHEEGDMQVLIITNSQDYDTIHELLKAGTKGVITKNCSEAELINALKAVSVGYRFYSNSILNLVIENSLGPEEACASASLSPRERQVLKLIAYGNTTEKIATKLSISIHTVNSHRKNILKKLNISSPIHLVAYAVETGLVKIDYNRK